MPPTERQGRPNWAAAVGILRPCTLGIDLPFAPAAATTTAPADGVADAAGGVASNATATYSYNGTSSYDISDSISNSISISNSSSNSAGGGTYNPPLLHPSSHYSCPPQPPNPTPISTQPPSSHAPPAPRSCPPPTPSLVYTQYIRSLYWAVTVIYTVGYGDVVPVHDVEKGFNLFVFFVGTCVFAMVSGLCVWVCGYVLGRVCIYVCIVVCDSFYQSIH